MLRLVTPFARAFAQQTQRRGVIALVTRAGTTSAVASISASVTMLPVRGFAKGNRGGDKKQKPSQPRTRQAAGAMAEEENVAMKSILEKARKNMNGGLLNFTRQLATMRPGRADAGIFDALYVQAYGQSVPLSQVAQVSVASATALKVNVYDPALVADVKKAIEGMNPCYSLREAGTALDVSFPKMSQETRMELIKAAKKQAEQARQHVRRVRQDAMNHAKKLKDELSEDEMRDKHNEIQQLTDDIIKEIGKLLDAKEKDLSAV